MENPFTEKYTKDRTDEVLIEKAVAGDRSSLEELILRHQDWVYNIAVRMVFNTDDAKDITQEVLIKIITKLSTFKGESSFRTWVYRIVINHILNHKKSSSETVRDDNFDSYAESIDKCPDYEIHSEMNLGFDTDAVVEEVKLSCMYGMLLCLDREQRIVFILGVLFGVSDKTGAELLDISKDNFRKKLSRARKDIFSFMNNKCGLMKKSNPCHCSKKAKALIDYGAVNPDNLMFNKNYTKKLKDIIPDTLKKYTDFTERKGSKLFIEHPFQNSPDYVQYIRNLINSNSFKDTFKIN
jgi:RNA polymerase sigma factor (sigma-70 family)